MQKVWPFGVFCMQNWWLVSARNHAPEREYTFTKMNIKPRTGLTLSQYVVAFYTSIDIRTAQSAQARNPSGVDIKRQIGGR